jgi:hypothetical protein
VRLLKERCKHSGFGLTGPLSTGPGDPVQGAILRVYDDERDLGCRIIIADDGSTFIERCERYGRSGLEPLEDEDLIRQLTACLET